MTIEQEPVPPDDHAEDDGEGQLELNGAVLVGVLLALALAAGTYIIGYQNGKGTRESPVSNEIGAAPAFEADELNELPQDNWLTNGGSLNNQRYSPLDQINTETVADLKGEWMTNLDGSGTAGKYSGEATPIVYDGVIYTITGANDVFAHDLETGRKIWKWEAELNQKINTICCGWTSRGVAIGEGKVYAGLLDGRLVALDQQSGELVWETAVGDWRNGETITNAPLYYNGRVYTGLSGGEYGIRGRLMAYNAETGEEDWRFWAIPGPGEEGHETWPQDNNSWKRGGAPIWQTPAVDPELGLMYFSAGNASPDLNGSAREGDNLFATSIVAIDADSGEYRWHFQQVHHDIWDYDAPSPVVLWDAEIDGEEVKGLSQPGKTGWLYILDRETGEPIHPIEEQPVPQEPSQATAKTQPIPSYPPFSSHEVSDEDFKEIQRLARDTLGKNAPVKRAKQIFTPFGETTTVIAPGPSGGTNWPPSSFSPDTNMVYVCGMDSASGYQSTELQEFERGTTYLSSIFTFTGFGAQDGVVAAIDVTTGEIAWEKTWEDQSCYSGTTATAGGLVFVGHNNGELIAYDAETGQERWKFQTGAGANATPAIVEHDGQEYVIFYAAGNSLAGSAHGDSLWAFSLEGTMGPVEPGSSGDAAGHAGQAEAEPEVEQEESTTPKGDGDAPSSEESDARESGQGEQIFSDNCAGCHGADGGGGNGGPPLDDGGFSLEQAIDQITNGGGGMPAFGDQLSDEEIRDLAAYVLNDIAGGGN